MILEIELIYSSSVLLPWHCQNTFVYITVILQYHKTRLRYLWTEIRNKINLPLLSMKYVLDWRQKSVSSGIENLPGNHWRLQWCLQLVKTNINSGCSIVNFITFLSHFVTSYTKSGPCYSTATVQGNYKAWSRVRCLVRQMVATTIWKQKFQATL
jgi:hypothetical protein